MRKSGVNMIELVKLADETVAEILAGEPISAILLKAQALSFLLGVEDFQSWVQKEQRGYRPDDELPEYRKVKCAVKAKLSIPFYAGFTYMDVPIDAISDSTVQGLLSKMFFTDPISEIEGLGKSAVDSELRINAPGMSHQFVQPLFPTSHVEAVCQITNSSSAISIVDAVKSVLLNFLLTMKQNKMLDINLSPEKKKEGVSRIIQQTIYGNVINADGSNILAPVVSGNNNVLNINTSKQLDDLKNIVSQLLALPEIKENKDVKEEVTSIQNEINSQEPNHKGIKKSFLFLKDFFIGTASSVAANLISQALSIL